MPKVFISYRRRDSPYVTHAVYDKLVGEYGTESVVFDIKSIPKGVDFLQYVQEQVNGCDILLAIIGDRWLNAQTAEGSRRLDDPDDLVRIEVQTALERKIPVIPVLVDEASMPAPAELPDVLGSLCFRNASEVRPGSDLSAHLDRLVQDVRETLQRVTQPKPSQSTTSPPPPVTIEFTRSMGRIAGAKAYGKDKVLVAEATVEGHEAVEGQSGLSVMVDEVHFSGDGTTTPVYRGKAWFHPLLGHKVKEEGIEGQKLYDIFGSWARDL